MHLISQVQEKKFLKKEEVIRNMGTRSTFLQKPTIEIDQDRYEELIRNELKYEQYMQAADEGIISILETNIDNKVVDESEEK